MLREERNELFEKMELGWLGKVLAISGSDSEMSDLSFKRKSFKFFFN